MTGVSTSCGACKFLRRKCTNECVFAPYFSYNEAVAHFGAVHKVFGASNVSRLLVHLPELFRGEAALSISFEALARMRYPVHGCVAYIYALQQEVANLQEEIEVLGHQMINDMDIIGISSEESCGGCQQNNNNHNLINSNHISLSSQEDQIINLPEIWSDSINNYQEETVLVLPTHAENGSCNTQMMMMNNSPCEFEGLNLFVSEAHGCLIEELLNKDSLDNSSLFGWLPNATTTS